MAMSKIFAGVAVAGVALTLTACGGNPIADAVNGAVENAVENQVENVIENQTGVDVDLDNGTGTASIPDGFPSDIATPPGNPASASRIDDMYFLHWANASEADYLDVEAKMKASGWTETYSSEMGDESSKILSWAGNNGEWSLLISYVSESSGSMIQYTVGPFEG